MPGARCWTRRAGVIGFGAEASDEEGEGGGMASISQMKQFVRAVLWKAEEMAEMKEVRNLGVGEDVEVIGGREEVAVVDEEGMLLRVGSTRREERGRGIWEC